MGLNTGKFKENWNREDKRCPNCNQITERTRGLTRQNLKRLIIPQWNVTELTITLMIIGIIIIGLSYKSEISSCQGWMNDMLSAGNMSDCIDNCNNKCGLLQGKEFGKGPMFEDKINYTINLDNANSNSNRNFSTSELNNT